MGFDVEELKSALARHLGFQKPSLFSFTITLPNLLQPIYTKNDLQDLSFLCLAGTLPGPTFDTVPIYRYGYGLPEKMPFNTIFNDVTYNFIGDSQGFIQNFFRNWQRAVMEFSSEGDINNPPAVGPNAAVPGMKPYLLNYKASSTSRTAAISGAANIGYATSITISTFDVTGSKMTDLVKMNLAYPINVTDQAYTWEMNDQFLIIPVTFTYQDTSYAANTNPTISLVNAPTITNTTQQPPDFFTTVRNIVSTTAKDLSNLI